MHGNVWEWCRDMYGAYPTGSVDGSARLRFGLPRDAWRLLDDLRHELPVSVPQQQPLLAPSA